MSRVLASPLGDVAVSRITRTHWTIAAVCAVAAHVLGAGLYWAYAPEPDAAAAEEVAIGVALGPPGGRLDPDPAPPPPTAPTPPRPTAGPTERAADAPPVTFTPPPPPAPPGARLSSGDGAGGDGLAPAPPPPPPPSRPPPLETPGFDRAALRAYVQTATQLIYDEIQYPARARDERVEGAATLRLTIGRRGQLIASDLVASTGNPLLDRAILDGVSRVRRFPDLPAAYPRDQFRINVTIRFQLIFE